MFGNYTWDKIQFISSLRYKDPETGEMYFGQLYVNRKHQLQLTRNARRMIREGLFTIHRIPGSKHHSKKYFAPGQTYLTLTEKGEREYFKLMKLREKKTHQHKYQ